MKRIFLFIGLWALAATTSYAQEASFLNFGYGTVQGTTELTQDPADTTGMTSGLKHDLAGTALGLSYTSVDDSGWAWGLGYHSYSLTGKGDWSSTTLVGATNLDVVWELETTEFSLKGPYLALGYGFGETFRVIPQFHVGISNQFSLKETLTSTRTQGDLTATGSDNYQTAKSGNLVVLVLPVYYAGESFIFGAEYHKTGNTVEIAETTNEVVSTYKASIANSLLFTVGYLF